jgi:hypothetical protein
VRRVMLGLGLIASSLVFGAVLLPEGEVVTIHVDDREGHAHSTHLWIVELEGQAYLRAASAGSPWLERLRGQTDVELVRGEGAAPQSLRAVIVDNEETARAVNEAMAEKYGISNSLVALFADSRASVPVRLEPRTGGGAPLSIPPTSPH